MMRPIDRCDAAGFPPAGERLMVQIRFARRPVALLLFDLDHFKSIKTNLDTISAMQ